MANHLRSGFPDVTSKLDNETLSALIATSISRAEKYGIQFEWDLQRFLEYTMVLSANFDTARETAWAGDILRKSNLCGAEKLKLIDDAYIFRHAAACDVVSE